ncbi:MAG: catI [Candidatus Rokubacteria bacterium]|nr:catI [Candidatus Rokubacteria bacterium]
MQEAVGRFVPDGASVCVGAALEALMPFAAGHELIRQRRRDLTPVGPISDILSDPGLVLAPALTGEDTAPL